jgi:hypothetical protein
MRLAKALFADVFSQIRFDIRGYIQAAVCQIRRKSDLLFAKVFFAQCLYDWFLMQAFFWC